MRADVSDPGQVTVNTEFLGVVPFITPSMVKMKLAGAEVSTRGSMLPNTTASAVSQAVRNGPCGPAFATAQAKMIKNAE
ncbi:MAG TPA: hypothetical protein VFQ79_18555 [Bryobacteraceae bacterium]|nr:hypothetical protein [Bryobacteraceae bacterium]